MSTNELANMLGFSFEYAKVVQDEQCENVKASLKKLFDESVALGSYLMLRPILEVLKEKGLDDAWLYIHLLKMASTKSKGDEEGFRENLSYVTGYMDSQGFDDNQTRAKMKEMTSLIVKHSEYIKE